MDIENGNYTRIHNKIIEELAKIKLNGSEIKLLLTIFRKTYGWQKKEANISTKEIVDMTGLSRVEISRTMKRLVSRKLVIKNDNYNPTKYAFNKHYSKWEVLSKMITAKPVIKNDNKSLSKMITNVIKNDNPIIKEKKERKKEISAIDLYQQVFIVSGSKTDDKLKSDIAEYGEESVISALKSLNKKKPNYRDVRKFLKSSTHELILNNTFDFAYSLKATDIADKCKKIPLDIFKEACSRIMSHLKSVTGKAELPAFETIKDKCKEIRNERNSTK